MVENKPEAVNWYVLSKKKCYKPVYENSSMQKYIW